MADELLTETEDFPNFNAFKDLEFRVDEKEKQILDITLAGCEKCDVVTPLKIIQAGNIVFSEKECCGEKCFLDDDAELFRKLYLNFSIKDSILKAGDSLHELLEKARENTPLMILYVNSKCNIDCPICYLKFSNGIDYGSSKLVPVDDIEKILELNKSSKIICLVGTEPTLREDLPDIIRKIKNSGRKCVLLTNGLKLLNKEYLRSLKEAGIWKITTWLDGFDNKVYRKLRGGNFLNAKLRILQNLKEEKIKTELIPVIGRNINEDQIFPIANFAAQNTDFIDSVHFDGLTTGRVYTKYTMGPSTLHKIIAEKLNIDLEYIVQFKRLRYNLFNMFNGLVMKHFIDNRMFLFGIFFLEVKNGELRQVLAVEELKKINNALESSRNKIKFLYGVIKNFRSFIKLGSIVILRLLQIYFPSLTNLLKLNKFSKRYLKIGIARVLPWSEVAGFGGLGFYVDYYPHDDPDYIPPRAQIPTT